MQRRPGLGSADILLSVTTISFDIAALELFLPLITGARVVIASREVAADGRRLMEQLAVCGASVMQATPTTWRMMLDAGWEGARDLKIICGGEPLPLSLGKRWRPGSNSVWESLGPTDTTVCPRSGRWNQTVNEFLSAGRSTTRKLMCSTGAACGAGRRCGEL